MLYCIVYIDRVLLLVPKSPSALTPDARPLPHSPLAFLRGLGFKEQAVRVCDKKTGVLAVVVTRREERETITYNHKYT